MRHLMIQCQQLFGNKECRNGKEYGRSSLLKSEYELGRLVKAVLSLKQFSSTHQMVNWIPAFAGMT